MSNLRKDGEVLHGQLIDLEFERTRPFTQQMQNCDQGGLVAAIGEAGAEIIPNDANSSLVKKFLLDNEKEELLGKFYGPIAMTIDNIRLPDELIGIEVVFSTASGTGEDTDKGYVTGDLPISLSQSARSTSSGGITADVQPNIKPHWADNVPGFFCEFFVESDSAAIEDVLTRLSTELGEPVLEWPVFHPETATITVTGMSMSLSASASARQSEADASESATFGRGKSIEINPTIRTVDISATIHRAIAITNTSQTISIDVEAHVEWDGTGIFDPEIAPNLGRYPPADTFPVDYDITGEVSPTNLSATDPANIPTSGLYLYNLRPQFFQLGLYRMLATLVDASIFQSPIIDFNYNDGEVELVTGQTYLIGPDFHGGFPDSYALQSGTLPTGLFLNTSTGIISGTLTGILTATVTIRATNSLGHVDEVLLLTITAP